MQRIIAIIICLLGAQLAHAGSSCSAPDQATKNQIVLIDAGNSVGSGVVISQNLILTAAHVIENTDNPQIGIQGTLIPAHLMSLDKKHDLALLHAKIPNIKPIRFSDRKLRRHEWVWAMGYPFGEQLIAASGRYQGTWSDAIYTSASVNYGQSGGGLIGCENNSHVLVGLVRAFGAVRENGKLVRRNDISIATRLEHIQRFIAAADTLALNLR